MSLFMNDKIKILFLLILVCFSIHIFNNKINSIPPIGRFLNPFHGYIVTANKSQIYINNLALKDSVEVVWDENDFPHIFAKNDSDLYMVQGYIVSSDRLWQMDFITRLHAGRLSEIIGNNDSVLKNDKFMRRIGITESAKSSLFATAYCVNQENLKYQDWDGLSDCPSGYQLVVKEPEVYDMLVSYSIGINKYIQSLSYRDLPIEYKILDYSPNLWTPLRTCLLLKAMSLDLTGRNTDIIYTNLVNTFGKDKADFLYSEIPYNNTPIIAREDFSKIENPILPLCDDELSIDSESLEVFNMYNVNNPGIGSNNWAVHKDMAKKGHAILANDPHLGLNLPNVWYVMHLSTPEQNVMGATMPGAPGILSGFNDYIAWGETNAAADVSDFYHIKIDSSNFNNYILDNKSVPFKKRVEKYYIRGDALNFPQIYFDTIKSTHHGPILTDTKNDNFDSGLSSIYYDVNLAFRWSAHDSSNEIKAFYDINHAKDYEDFEDALLGYKCPAQNFVYADIDGNVAMHHNGKIPIRCEEYGKSILPGHLSTYDWKNFIPYEHLPKVKNPKKGYVSSANQYPMVESYPYYFPGNFWPSYRGSRINDLLDSMISKGVTIDDMKKIQNDDYNKFAEDILPNLLLSLEQNELFISDSIYLEIHKHLKKWSLRPVHDKDKFEPIIFDKWYENLNHLTWEDLFSDNKNNFVNINRIYPLYDKLAKLIENQDYWNSEWFDDSRTDKKENFHDIAYQSFKMTIDDLLKNENLRDKKYKNWKYSDYRGTSIHHMLSSDRFDSFSRINIKTGGSKWAPNAMKKKFGPSWRYIVEMKKDSIYAIGIYPGGQSGNPGSLNYDNFIDKWKDGEYLNLNFTYYKDRSSLKGRKMVFYNGS
ncbi:MAG: hypothetical protein CMG00_08830 [Candidatus Marinimicrobia bacterium]|nr:hypothetical protein [Candidatus Neomarinimicrobiota bacterium]